MDPVSLVAGVPRVLIDTAEPAEILRGLEALRRVRGRVDASEVALARRLAELTPLAERDVAAAAQREGRHGDRVRDRVETAGLVPVLGDAFDAGDVDGEHIDTVTKALRAAPVGVREGLAAAVSGMVGDVVSSGLTPQDLAQRLATETKRLEGDDGVARLDRQRRATRLRSWTDRHSGMFRVSGSFDPFTGLAIQGRLNAAMAAMFANGYPDCAPDDPGERQDFLRALAFVALTAGRPADNKSSGNKSAGTDSDPGGPGGSGSGVGWVPFGNSGPPRFGRPEVIVVVDHTTPDVNGRPTVDWGGPIDLPFECVEDLCRVAAIHTVTVNGGNVVDPDGALDLGRSTRLANRAQRRALRALYSTCAVPGCAVRYEFTEPHHIKWWRNGGKTDLINLIPLCARHHTNAHSNGWVFMLGPNRELTITLPTGQTMSTGPPKQHAA